MNHVMVVEDDTTIRDTLCELIESEGYAAIPAGNGREALDALHQHRGEVPRLILLDMMMPVMDGWAFCTALATEERFASVPIIVISAHARVEAIAAELHVAGYLKKPLDLDELVAVLARFAC